MEQHQPDVLVDLVIGGWQMARSLLEHVFGSGLCYLKASEVARIYSGFAQAMLGVHWAHLREMMHFESGDIEDSEESTHDAISTAHIKWVHCTEGRYSLWRNNLDLHTAPPHTLPGTSTQRANPHIRTPEGAKGEMWGWEASEAHLGI